MFSTRLFQTGECVSAASTGLASCSPAYLSPSYVFSDVVFAQVIMQGDFGMLEHQQELRLPEFWVCLLSVSSTLCIAQIFARVPHFFISTYTF